MSRCLTLNGNQGHVFTNLRMIGGQITIVSKVMKPAPSPISDFGIRDHVQIGLRDDCGNTQIVNQGNVPMFDLKDKAAVFFVQNCLLGMPTPGIASSSLLIRHTGSQSLLILNLLGQNQTGPNPDAPNQGCCAISRSSRTYSQNPDLLPPRSRGILC